MFLPYDRYARPRKYAVRSHSFQDPVSCEKKRAAHLGKPSPNKGKSMPGSAWRKGQKGPPRSLEVRRKISAALIGDKSYRWRGGISGSPRTGTLAWRETRKRIYERDNWTCAVCGTHCRKNINCHHIIPVRHNGPDDDWNLVTVCVRCHATQEWRYGSSLYFWGYFSPLDYGIVAILNHVNEPLELRAHTCIVSATPTPPATNHSSPRFVESQVGFVPDVS